MCFSCTSAKKKEQKPIVKFKGLALEMETVEKFTIIAFKSTRGENSFREKKKRLYTVEEEKF